MSTVSVAIRTGLATILLFSLISVAYAGAPALPCEFYGTVTIDGNSAPVGTVVTAKVGDQERGQFTLEQEGIYGGPGTFDKRLKVVTTDTDLSAGTPTITFWINGEKAWQESTFQAGVSVSLDLSTGGPAPQTSQVAQPVKTQLDSFEEISVPDPSQAGPVVVPAPTVVPALESPKTKRTDIPPIPSLPGIPEPTDDVGLSDGLMANFEAFPQSGSAPLIVQFNDLSSGNPTMWSWDYGDGSEGDFIADPVHIYENPGVYSVSLTVANQDGSSDTETKVSYIMVSAGEDIVANFYAEPQTGSAPLSVQFIDLSSGIPTMWSWDFGDGSTDTIADPVHVYQNPGSYSVTLTASNQKGSDSEIKEGYITVTQQGVLTADFTGEPTTGDAPLSVYFIDESVGNPVSWLWDFGDGQTDTREDTVHLYSQPGLFTVSLTVMDANGTKSSKQKEAYISVLTPGELISDFKAEPVSGIVPLSVSFTDLSIGVPTLWSWDFGDGYSDMVENPVHVYQTPGNYTVILTVSNQKGGIATKEKKSYIKAKEVPTPVPTMTVIPIPQVPENYFGTAEIYGKPISVGGMVEARVPGYNVSSEFNPIKTSKGSFGKNGTFSKKLQVQGVPVGSDVEFYMEDVDNQQVRAYIQNPNGSLMWSKPYEPGKETELHLVYNGQQPTVIPTIPITPVPTDCPGVPAIPMTFAGDLHITTGDEYLLENSSCQECEPNAESETTIEAKIDGYDITGPSNPITLSSIGYFGGGNSSWVDKLAIQAKCVPEGSDITFWVTAPSWQRAAQAYVVDGSNYTWNTQYQPAKEATIHLWVGPIPKETVTPTPTPTPLGWSPQKFYGMAEFNGYPLRAGDRVMATTDGVDLSSPTNPISVIELGKYGDLTGDELLMVEVPYYALNQNAPIYFWIKPQGFEFWYKAWVKNPLSGEPWKQSYPFTPGSITNLDIRSDDREEFMYFYDIITAVKNAILPDDYTGW